MSKIKKFTKDDLLAAIKGSGGIVSTIAKKLGCDWHTAKKYIMNWESTKQAYEDAEETVLDLAEGVLIKSIKRGNTQDAKWLLARRRKDKYSERQELTGKDGVDIAIAIVNVDTNKLK